jgi:hypothetical protein
MELDKGGLSIAPAPPAPTSLLVRRRPGTRPRTPAPDLEKKPREDPGEPMTRLSDVKVTLG